MESLVSPSVSVFTESIIYADQTGSDQRWNEPGIKHLPFFYLHGEAERLNGFDCCGGNLSAFIAGQSEGITPVTIKFLEDDMADRKALMFTYKGSMNRMEARICLIDDLEGIKDVIQVAGAKCIADCFLHGILS